MLTKPCAIAAPFLVALIGLAPGASAAPGDLDPSFGTGGIATATTPGGAQVVRVGGPSSDQRIVVAGGGTLTAVKLTSLRSDGTVAWQKNLTGTAFGITDPNQGDQLRLEDAAIAADGRTAFVARHGLSTAAIGVFKPDGSFDTSFDGDGKRSVQANGFGPMRLAFQSDGKLIVAFSGNELGGGLFEPGVRLQRFTTSGAPDSGFGTNGKVDAPPPPCCGEQPLALAVSSSSISVLGARFAFSGSGDLFAGVFLRRFTSGGVFDSTLDARLSDIGFPRGLGVDSSGRYVVAEPVDVPADQGVSDAVVERRLSDGSRDTAFGPSGQRSVELRAPTAARTASVETTSMGVSGAKIYVAGRLPFTSGGPCCFVARVTSDGALDPAFGPADGTSAVVPHVVSLSTGSLGTAMAVQPDGRVVVAGAQGDTIKVARLLAECVAFACTITLQPTVSGVTITSQLNQTTSVGIIVRRRVGKRLVDVGRVPLGRRAKGRNRIAWNLKVNGKRLSPGSYEVTLRALDKNGRVFDLSRPAKLTVGRSA